MFWLSRMLRIVCRNMWLLWYSIDRIMSWFLLSKTRSMSHKFLLHIKSKNIRSFLVYWIRWYNHMWSMLQWTMLHCKFILIVWEFFYDKNEFLVRWNCLYLCTAIQRQCQLFMLWLWTTAVSTSRHEWQIIIPKNKQTNKNENLFFSSRFSSLCIKNVLKIFLIY